MTDSDDRFGYTVTESDELLGLRTRMTDSDDQPTWMTDSDDGLG